MRHLLVVAALLFALAAHAEVTFDWATVGDPGNPADTEVMGDGTTGYGTVYRVYRISRYETTNAQYAEFLNAVAATDTYALYSTEMGAGLGGITRSGSPGSYTYSAIAGREDMPVVHVSWYDSLRFANWLQNGQPSGAQDSTTTEDGAYTFSGATSVDPRNAGATIFLPSEDEWYKAAYYDAGPQAYFDYPAGTDDMTTCATPGAAPNTANCMEIVADLTDAGSYTGSPSPNGTFDQGGNVFEWSETIIDPYRVLRGGSWRNPAVYFAASARNRNHPGDEYVTAGFRVAAVDAPQPIPALSRAGAALLWGLLGGMGLAGLVITARRRHG